jgi:DNA mismatch repair protein MutL
MSIIPGKIRLLDDNIVHQIAAGEVVERPASVLKELIENAMDAGATKIHAHWRHGGCSMVRVDDNGCGMSKDDIMMAVQQHATSKLPDDKLDAIATFGFRGEALSSIVSVSRVKVTSCMHGAEHGWTACFEGGEMVSVDPCVAPVGTSVEVRDLFYTTPVRLKFMRSTPSEHKRMIDIFEKFFISQKTIDFFAQWDDTKTKARTGSLDQRIAHIFGPSFLKDSFLIDTEQLGYRIRGRMGLPACHRATSNRQIFFVNGRWIKDRGMIACLRRAFGDTIPVGRQPMGVLFLDMPLADVDVNVHPVKTEVRFLETRFVYGLIEGAVKKAIFENSLKSKSLNLSIDISPDDPAEDLVLSTESRPSDLIGQPVQRTSIAANSVHQDHMDNDDRYMAAEGQDLFSHSVEPASLFKSSTIQTMKSSICLGRAIGQVQDAYIVSCNKEGLVLVDPHAAHERILYEKMKTEWMDSLGHVQPLLISQAFKVTPKTYDYLMRMQAIMNDLGFDYDLKAQHMCHILSIPAIFACYSVQDLLEDLCDHVEENDDPKQVIVQWRDHMMANWSCRKSLRLGQSMSLQEMNALLRDIEKTPHGAQCNHGRSVYRMITMTELARFFDR